MSQSVSPERPSSAAASRESRITTKKEDLPPPQSKEDRGIRSNVKNPLEQVRLTTLVHVLICVLLLVLAWYTYRTIFVAVDAFRSRGGAFSFPSTSASASSSFSAYADPIWRSISKRVSWRSRDYSRFLGFSGRPYADVERRVEELADALGVRPLDLANAIADAVHQLVPTEALSSLASEAKKKGGGRIMDALRGEYAHGVHIADGVRGRMG